MSDTAVLEKKVLGHIRFDFSPVSGANQYAVETDEGGHKRRWLYGISSGEQLDGHGERMTSNCIESFNRQAHSGDILLFAGKHEVDFTDDVGILRESRIDENGDWITGYRLYDELDGVGQAKLERIGTIWKQVNGLPPYTKPKPYGFSIEGVIPEDGIKYVDTMGRRTMDDVELAGSVLVRRPAYQSSVAQAVYKALGIPTQNEIRKALLGDRLAIAAQRQEERSDYYDEYYQINSALEEMVRQIMQDAAPDKNDRLREIFDEYSLMMIDLVVKNPGAFQDSDSVGSPCDAAPSTLYEAQTSRKQDLLTRLVEAQDELAQFVNKVRQEGDPHAQTSSTDQSEDGS